MYIDKQKYSMNTGDICFRSPGQEVYSVGDYDGSAEKWNKVLEKNGNYDLAYIGLGKSCFRQNKFKEAMDYFRLKRDKKNYSKAYQYYRKEWVEDNIGWVFALILAIIFIPIIVKICRKIAWEMKTL